MIRFSLECGNGHGFDGWFRSSEDHDEQARRGLLTCPVCDSAKISKALMAPAVATSRKREAMTLATDGPRGEVMAEMQALAKKLREGSENVGGKFAEEARKIHYGEAEARSIYGKASPEEAVSLAEEGVGFMPLPPIPEDQN